MTVHAYKKQHWRNIFQKERLQRHSTNKRSVSQKWCSWEVEEVNVHVSDRLRYLILLSTFEKYYISMQILSSKQQCGLNEQELTL